MIWLINKLSYDMWHMRTPQTRSLRFCLRTACVNDFLCCDFLRSRSTTIWKLGFVYKWDICDISRSNQCKVIAFIVKLFFFVSKVLKNIIDTCVNSCKLFLFNLIVIFVYKTKGLNLHKMWVLRLRITYLKFLQFVSIYMTSSRSRFLALEF